SEIQELGDMIPKLLEVSNRSDAPIRIREHIEFGDGQKKPSAEYLAEVNTLLRKIKDSFGLR
ncbi:MAG: hypothetical protein P9M15_03580, partial [Candidatus Electryoneaceae bacterium]|nr:hypothetical protein [Candidatus Electryoneaceae bacterium]